MHIAVSGKHLGRCREIESAVFAPYGRQFGTAGKKLRRPTFIRLDVGALMTKDALERPAELREAEGIGRGTVEDDEGPAIGLKNFAHLCTDPFCPWVVTVGNFGAVIRLGQRGHGLRTDAGGIIARELMAVAARHQKNS